MSVAWPTAELPLSKLYGVQTGYEDNAIQTEYDSGRVVQYQRNTKNRRRYSVSYAASKAQEVIFFDWYENTLGGNAGTFTAPSLRGNNQMQEYRLEGTPTSSGMNIKEINMIWVEV
ncbi:MAG: hypothetical protein MJ168_12415 [Clostridia bacterium]|nr:hypothetical protein [Clostridia bacterium]